MSKGVNIFGLIIQDVFENNYITYTARPITR